MCIVSECTKSENYGYALNEKPDIYFGEGENVALNENLNKIILIKMKIMYVFRINTLS